MKKILLIMSLVILLSGCNDEKLSVGKFNNVIVKDKRIDCEGCRWYSYYITIEKEGQELELKIDNSDEGLYKALRKGNEISVTYDEDFKVVNIVFPKLESK